MYFLWRDTPYGIIRISYEGLKDFTNDILKSKLRLYSLTLSSGEIENHESPADITVVIADDELQPDKRKTVEAHLSEVLKPMGMNASVVWAIPERGIMPLIRSPLTWAVTASCSAVIITAGFDGFFWTVFWGVSAWFAIWGLSVLAKKIRRA